MKYRSEILDEARASMTKIRVAAVVLVTATEDRHVVTYTPEYGDGDGIGTMKDFIEDCSELLSAGERMCVEVRECYLTNMSISEVD